jgi:poly(A) polymerase
MALSRERIADELLKLLGVADPAPTVRIMLKREILKPVLPEIVPERLSKLEGLLAREVEAGLPGDALRRLAALIPRDPAIAEDIAVRLRLSNKARKRLACSASTELLSSPQALAYRLGTDCAVDRLLLAGLATDASAIFAWHAPRLPISGGTLIERGLSQGPIVAQALRKIEDRWVSEGFPAGDAFERIVSAVLAEP